MDTADPRPAPTVGSPVEAVDRALVVLTALARAGARGSSLAELAGGLGLNKTTLHRVLAALRYRDFVAQDPATGAYLLGPAVTQLADEFLSEENLPVLLHPALVALCSATEELVHLGVLHGTAVVYLDKVEPERSVRVWSAVGRRIPAVRTALGRAVLAFGEPTRAALAGYLTAADDGGPGPEVDAARLADVLAEARRRGYATEDQENEPGISCVAVPLLRGAAPVAAVSITAPADRMTPQRVRDLHQRMRTVLPPLLPPALSLPDAGARDNPAGR